MNAPRSQDRSASDLRTLHWPLLLKRGLLAYAAVIVAIGWLYGYSQVRSDRELTLEASGHQLTTIASALGTHVAAMINDGVGAAEAAYNEITALGGLHRLSRERQVDVLQRMLTGGEYVREVFVATPSLFSAAQRPQRLSNGQQYQTTDDRPEWLSQLFVHSASERQTTWIGHAINREFGDAKILIPIAKRVAATDDGSVWVGALFGIESLDRMYRSLPIEQGGVALVSIDGELLIRIPTVSDVNLAGRDVTVYEAFKRYRTIDQDLIMFEAPNPFTEVPRQFAVQRIPNYPFVAVAGRDIGDSLASWRKRTRNSLQLGVAATIALGILTAILYVVVQRRYEALRRSQERFQLAVAGSNDGIWDWELKSNIVYYSPRLKHYLGFAENDEFPSVPDTFWNLVHPDDVAAARAAVQRHLAARDPYDIEYRVRTRGGEYRWFNARAQATWDASGSPLRMAGSISDVHERKSIEQSLREAKDRELHAREEFAQHLLLAQEQERQRLANELHDSVGQNLSLIKNRALLVLQETNLPSAASQHVLALSQLATEVIAEVRAVAQNLRPLHIEQLGLTDALETLLNKVSEGSRLTITKRLENVDDVIAGTAATHLFRIVQEAFNNILKHAGATRCQVLLERDLHSVRLTIADNGRGFDPATAATAHGLGLASIAERVRMLTAVWNIDCNNGDGTTIKIEIPVEEAALDESA